MPSNEVRLAETRRPSTPLGLAWTHTQIVLVQSGPILQSSLPAAQPGLGMDWARGSGSAERRANLL